MGHRLPAPHMRGRCTRCDLLAALVALALIFGLCGTVGVWAAPHFGYGACDPAVVQSSGYIDIPGVNNTQKHYFYWLFGPRRWPTDGSQPPVVMWLQGGPGCSSSGGLLIELGPCMMNETTGNLHRNAYGWNDEAYLLFVDQSTGVGFSYADKANYVHNESEAAEDMYNFLQGFARRFTSPSITGANDFYIAGESYGGHYVPAFAHRIVVGNQRGDGPHINLKGIAVGNGLTDPYTQYPSYVTMAYDYCTEKLGYPCINESVRAAMLADMPHCLDLIAQCNALPDDTDPICRETTEFCETVWSRYSKTGRSDLNIREPCVGNGCYTVNASRAFLRSHDVVSALGVPTSIAWDDCNTEVYDMFVPDYHRGFNWTIPPLLAAGVRVIIYAGDLDYVCNWIGNKAWVTALDWPGKAAFNAAPDVEFSVGGAPAGQERAYGNFSFVRIYEAGHMVPMDQPAAALYMLSRMLQGKLMVS